MIIALLIIAAIGVGFGFAGGSNKSFNKKAAVIGWILAGGGYFLLWISGNA